MNTDRKQSDLQRNEKGHFTGGTPPAGFNAHPENRSNGRWKKEDSISYNYNLFLSMTEDDFKQYKPVTKAQRIAYNRIKASEDEKYGLAETKEITDRTEGKAPQSVDVTTQGESINPYAALTTEELRKLAGKK